MLQLLFNQFERIFDEFSRLSDFVEKFDVRLAEEKKLFDELEKKRIVSNLCRFRSACEAICFFVPDFFSAMAKRCSSRYVSI